MSISHLRTLFSRNSPVCKPFEKVRECHFKSGFNFKWEKRSSQPIQPHLPCLMKPRVGCFYLNSSKISKLKPDEECNSRNGMWIKFGNRQIQSIFFTTNPTYNNCKLKISDLLLCTSRRRTWGIWMRARPCCPPRTPATTATTHLEYPRRIFTFLRVRQKHDLGPML